MDHDLRTHTRTLVFTYLGNFPLLFLLFHNKTNQLTRHQLLHPVRRSDLHVRLIK